MKLTRNHNREIQESWNKFFIEQQKRSLELIAQNYCSDSLSLFHDWEHYVGFTEKYKFCKRCDKKVF